MGCYSRIKGTLAGTILAAAIAVNPAFAEPVTLDVFYAQPSFAKFHEPIAQAFMKKYPDIKIAFRAPAADYDVGHQAMIREAVVRMLATLGSMGTSAAV